MNFHSKASPPSRTSVKLKKLAISAGVALACGGAMISAQATNYTLPTALTTTNTSTFYPLPLSGAFSDTFSFILATGTLDVVGVTSYWDTVAPVEVDFSLSQLVGGTATGTPTTVVANATLDLTNHQARYHYTFTGLTALDNYALTVSGDATHLGSQYALQMVAAVPEPESYAMLLAGLGLVGAMVRRRKSTAKGS